MSEFLQRISNLSPDRLRLLAAELKTRLDRAEGRLAERDDPIAVVGIGCRFPGGANSPDAFWRLLREGVDAITEVPAERWNTELLYDEDPEAPGTATSRWGSFLEGLEDFDPWFFGISPREAVGMDPQHRLLLEVAWEALEHAGISPERLEGTPTGVFLGLCNHDFHALRLEQPYQEIDSYFASGVAGSMAAGRISYLLGLQGPSFTVDTACSSSLVALHLACESLRNGESTTALAAGVSLILTPETMIGLSKSKILSDDGRCRTFDADARGIARGEGCGVVVLKRLSDARRDGDRVLAVIRATGINQDGRSNGITAPNGPAQEALLRSTLAKSGLRPADIDYVEAHGTGTTLGDPIEVRALGAVYGDRPADRPLQIGSVKTNLGHLEASAGIAGFIKLVLSLQHRELPPHLHLQTPNPHIEWDQLPVRVATDLAPWTPASEQAPRRGAVSAFGFSGTNAHAIVEEAPVPAIFSAEQKDRSAHVLVLSARTEVLLRELAHRYAERLESASVAELADICHTAATGRSHFAFRLAVAGETPAAISAELRQWLASGEAPAVRAGRTVTGTAAEPVFVFTGQGSQSVGMGRELYETQPVFRAALDRCDEILRGELPVRLLDILYPAEGAADGAGLIDRTEYAQPALFALEYALAELWRSWGVEPAAVIGHSLGEYVAATVAGLFSLEDGLRLVARRGRLMQSLPEGGAMAAVFTDLAAVEEAIAPYRDSLSVAAINGAQNVVISGDERVLTRILEELRSDGVESRRLVVSGAFHSPLMEPVLDRFEEMLGEVTFHPPHIPIVSNLTGRFNEPGELETPAYWREHLRQPVQFLGGVQTLAAAGYRTFLEIGPHPTLTGLLAGALNGGDELLVNSLRRGRDDWAEIAAAAGALHTRGVSVDWEAFDSPWLRRPVPLPTTPFDRRRFWPGWSQKAQGLLTTTPSTETRAETDWIWEYAWEDAGIATSTLDLEGVAERLTRRAPALVEEHGAGDYTHGLPLLDAMSTALILRGLRRLGYSPSIGDRLTADGLRERFGILPAHQRLVERMLAILAEDGILVREGGEYGVLSVPSDVDPQEIAERLYAEAPGMRSEVEMTLRTGSALAEVLRGEADPLELLFPGGSTDEASALYGEAPSFRVFNTLVRDAVLEVVRTRPGKVRILEVGGGTGGVTRALLPALPRERTEYVFTDISPLFITRAKERFADFPGFSGSVLDLTHSAAEQGFERESFDIIVASNVLHATPDLRQTLRELHTLLAPGGAVVVLEGILPQRFGDLTVGLTDGWWSFTDTNLRPDYALMDPERWAKTFAAVGFESPVDLPRGGPAEGVLAQQRVLLARRPVEAVFGAADDSRAPRWLAIVGDGVHSREAADSLAGAGVQIYTLSHRDPAHLQAEMERLRQEGPLDVVVHLASLDEEIAGGGDGSALIEQQRRISTSALIATQALIRHPGPRLMLVTRGAEQVHSGEAIQPSGATLWGLARGIGIEHPELRCVAVDLDATEEAAQTLIALAETEAREDQLAVRDGVALAARIRPAAVAAATPVRFERSAAYLITGGVNGLGLRVARWMAKQGAGKLILASRSEPGADARAAVAELTAAGTSVELVRGDVADSEGVKRMVAAAGALPLRGVIHSAGVTDDAAIASLAWERIERVMRAKVAGSWNLHLATREMELDHFVLFSSGAAFLGSPGQANHAMANNFMGALAQHRRAAGLPALSIDWGPWAEVGAATRDGVLERARSAGLNPIEVDPGLEMLGRLMADGGGTARVAAIPVDWPRYLANIPGGAERAWFDRVRGETSASPVTTPASDLVVTQTPAADEAFLATALLGSVAGRRSEVALDGIRSIASRVLGAGDDSDIDPLTPLTELGLDSLMAVEMRNRLAKALGQPLPATLLFNYPSLDALAAYVVDAVVPAAEPAPVDTPASEAAPATASDHGALDLDDMSEDEMADLLAAKLRDL